AHARHFQHPRSRCPWHLLVAFPGSPKEGDSGWRRCGKHGAWRLKGHLDAAHASGAGRSAPGQQHPGRIPMQRTACGAVVAAMLVLSTATLAQTPSWSPPPESQRCPSKWGAGDERGSGNHMKPPAVLNAAKLIRTGEVIELGHVLSGNMPFSGPRRFDLHTKRTVMNPQSNNRGSNEEMVLSEIGQV